MWLCDWGRLGPEASVHAGNRLFLCAMCHCSLEADTGISVHAGSFFSQISAGKAWQGPFLCANCKTKQDARQDAEKEAKQDAEKEAKQDAEKEAKQDGEKEAKEDGEKETKQDAEKKAKQDSEKRPKQDAEQVRKRHAGKVSGNKAKLVYSDM